MENNINKVMGSILNKDVIRATLYISVKQIIRATKKRYGNKLIDKQNIEIALTIGKPNYVEKEYIKMIKKTDIPFPILKVKYIK